MRILITYGRQLPYPTWGVHLTQAFEEAGHEALLLCVRDRPWWGTLAKRAPKPWKSWWRWDPVAWANEQLLRAAQRYRPEALLEFAGSDYFENDAIDLLLRRPDIFQINRVSFFILPQGFS